MHGYNEYQTGDRNAGGNIFRHIFLDDVLKAEIIRCPVVFSEHSRKGAAFVRSLHTASGRSAPGWSLSGIQVSHIRQQRDGPGSFDGHCQRPLVLGAGAGDSPGYDFTAFGYKML